MDCGVYICAVGKAEGNVLNVLFVSNADISKDKVLVFDAAVCFSA